MMTFDRFQRRIHYLRISVTDRCNFRCVYCMPPEGVALKPHAEILSFEEIEDVARIAVGLGVDKVRLTGGEPLVRRGIADLVRRLAVIPGIRDLAMTTNGARLAGHAAALRAAGLHRVNISLDCMDPERYRAITRGGRVEDTLAGIEAAIRAGFGRIKLNCVVGESPDEPDAVAVAAFGRERGLEVRFIRRMDTGKGTFWPVFGGDGGNCLLCNRLRLSSDGFVYPCLFSDARYSVREMGAEAALRAAVANKPECGQHSRNRFYEIGG